MKVVFEENRLTFSEYVKSYNPFNIQLELEDYDDDDEFNEED